MSNPPKIKSQRAIITGVPDNESLPFIKRRDQDSIADFQVTLKDINQAVHYYINNVIQPRVTVNNELIKVPLIYANPDKWKSIQYDGFYRDKEQKIQLPLIAFHRTSIAKNRTLGSKIDANHPQLQVVRGHFWSEKNAYSSIDAMQHRKPVETTYYVVIPDYVDLTYEFILWTDNVRTMDILQEAFIFAEGSYWGDPNQFMFRTLVEDMSSQAIIEEGTDKGYRVNFSMKMYGYIIPNNIQSQLAAINLAADSPAKIIINKHI